MTDYHQYTGTIKKNVRGLNLTRPSPYVEFITVFFFTKKCLLVVNPSLTYGISNLLEIQNTPRLISLTKPIFNCISPLYG